MRYNVWGIELNVLQNNVVTLLLTLKADKKQSLCSLTSIDTFPKDTVTYDI